MRDQRGSAAVEWTLLAPVVVLLIGAMVAGFRFSAAKAAVADAAHAGARAASLQRDARTAQARGQQVAAANLLEVHCEGVIVDLDVSGFQVPVGQPADIQAQVSCQVPLADLLVPGVPGALTVSAAATAVLDTHRGRR